MTSATKFRALSAAADVAMFATLWCVAIVAIATALSSRYPDNPWGNLAFAVMAGFVLSLGGLAAVESSVDSPGRLVTGIQLRSSTGDELRRWRTTLRSTLKYGGWGALVFFTANLPLEQVLLAVLGVIALNAVAIVSRRDGRSLLDLAVGSQSVAPRTI